MTFSICTQLRSSIYEVSCVSCYRIIGTMTGETFNRAMDFARWKGGIKCPECRARSCSTCGLEQEGLDSDRLCFYCGWELAIELDENTKPRSMPLV